MSNFKVKATNLSPYYGVRPDKRVKNGAETIYYRAEIMAQGKKFYLGAYTQEEHAAYAFNVGFEFVASEKYNIENFVGLSNDERKHIEQKVKELMIKKGLIINSKP